MSDLVENLDKEAAMIAELVAAKDEVLLFREQVRKDAQTIAEEREELAEFLSRFGELSATLQSLQTEIGEITTNAETQKEQIGALLGEITQRKSDFQKLAETTQNLHNDLTTKQEEAAEKYDKIENLHNDLLIDEKDAQGEITEPCLQTRIFDLEGRIEQLLEAVSKDRSASQAELVAIKDQTTKDFAALKETLTQDIHKLLPDAGAAGLAGAYCESKSVYGRIPSETSPAWKDPQAGNYILFLGPLAFMAYEYFYMFKDVAQLDWGMVMFRVLIAAPLAIISYFGWSSIQLSRKLYEAYNHKQRVMQLYRSFKEEIDGAGTREQKEALLSVMLKTVDEKASSVVTKDASFMPDIKIPFLSNREGQTDQENSPSAT